MSTIHKLLILEESVLVTMANNPNFMKEFAFLKGIKSLKQKSTGCGKCNRNAGRRSTIVNSAKQVIVNMGAERKRRLKQLLKAEKVRVRVVNNGKVVDYTF